MLKAFDALGGLGVGYCPRERPPFILIPGGIIVLLLVLLSTRRPSERRKPMQKVKDRPLRDKRSRGCPWGVRSTRGRLPAQRLPLSPLATENARQSLENQAVARSRANVNTILAFIHVRSCCLLTIVLAGSADPRQGISPRFPGMLPRRRLFGCLALGPLFAHVSGVQRQKATEASLQEPHSGLEDRLEAIHKGVVDLFAQANSEETRAPLCHEFEHEARRQAARGLYMVVAGLDASAAKGLEETLKRVEGEAEAEYVSRIGNCAVRAYQDVERLASTFATLIAYSGITTIDYGRDYDPVEAFFKSLSEAARAKLLIDKHSYAALRFAIQDALTAVQAYLEANPDVRGVSDHLDGKGQPKSWIASLKGLDAHYHRMMAVILKATGETFSVVTGFSIYKIDGHFCIDDHRLSTETRFLKHLTEALQSSSPSAASLAEFFAAAKIESFAASSPDGTAADTQSIQSWYLTLKAAEDEIMKRDDASLEVLLGRIREFRQILQQHPRVAKDP